MKQFFTKKKNKGNREEPGGTPTVSLKKKIDLKKDFKIEESSKLQVQEFLKDHYGDCKPPCQLSCPCGVPCGQFIRLCREGRYEEGLRAVADRNPFAIVCGTVCPRFCEMECRRHVVDEPVAINDIKRFLGEFSYSHNPNFTFKKAAPTGKKIAVIGAGPAGLANAHFMAKLGHEVTVYDMMEKPGGMLLYGIPAYRLPKSELQKEIDIITTSLGVKFQFGKKLGKDITIDDLKKNYDKCFMAIGAWKSMGLPLENDTGVENIYKGIDFLRDVTQGKAPKIGKKVIVIGGGNVSFDVARTCRRLGAETVTLTCILKEEDMPAFPIEINEAKEEGIVIKNLTQPMKILKDGDRLTGLEFRKRPACADIMDFTITIPGTEFTIDADSVIIAIGQEMNKDECIANKIPHNRYIKANPNTYKVEGFNDFLYAGGDCVIGPYTVVHCVCTARTAAYDMHKSLTGKEAIPEEPKYLHTRGTNKQLLSSAEDKKPKRVPLYNDITRSHRQPMVELSIDERITTFKQVLTLCKESEILAECDRCMQCGCSESSRCKLRKQCDKTEVSLKQTKAYGYKEDFFNPHNLSVNIPQKPTKKEENNPFIIRDLDKCIKCEKCIDVCRDIRCISAIEDLPSMKWNSVDTSYRKGNPDPYSCESCGTCLDNCPTNALVSKRLEMPADKKVKTTCPYCGCGCGLELSIRGNICQNAKGVVDHPASHGQLCVKGRFGIHYSSSPDRLKQPLIRKDGELKPASWEEALTLVASKFEEIKQKYGPDAIAGFSSAKVTNEENYLFMKFMRAAIGTNNVDHCARLCHASTVAGLAKAFGSGAMTNSIDELRDSKCILVTGSNTTETHPIVALAMKEAKKRGCKIIVADPRKINLTEYAYKHVKQRSGTDVALFSAMINHIISKKLHDVDYIKNYCEKFEDFEKSIKEYTPEWAEKITGIKKDDICDIADIFATSKPASIVFSMGITQHSTGTDNVLTLAHLSMLTGNVGKHGGGVNPLRGQNNVQGACDMGGLPNVYSGYQKVELESVREKFTKLWGVEMPSTKGHTVTTAINAAYDGTLKSIYIMGENPAISDPNLNHAREALKKLEFLVVQDIFLTPTTEYAHVVLPATSFMEKTGTFTNTERRVLRVNPATIPIDECRQDWEIIADIANRLGYKMNYPNGCLSIMDEINTTTPSYAGITNKRIDSGDYLQWPCLDTNHSGTKILHKDGKFARGKGLFTVTPFKEPAELPDDKYPLVLTTGRVLYQFHTGTMSRQIDGLNELAPTTHVELTAEDAKKYGIEDKNFVKVITRRGEITGIACVPSRVSSGHVFMPFHYAEAPANLCTNDALDPVAKIPEFKACACRIEKATVGNDPQKSIKLPINLKD